MNRIQLRPAVFLDRDGVLVEDVDLLTDSKDLRILPGVPGALNLLKSAGFCLIMVSNQPVVARGMISEEQVANINQDMVELLVASGAPKLDALYFCPFHPQANLTEYRQDSDHRKPKPGMLLKAAKEHDLDLNSSFMVGDRITDIIAGARAGCRCILVETGKHLAPMIQTTEPVDSSNRPNFTCTNLLKASEWIIQIR